MFPDGGMAKNLQCGSTKASYVTTFDLTPYFHSLLFLNISSSPHQVVSIDESLNNSVQERQMALLIRYWDNNTDIVCTCYMESKFIGSSTAGSRIRFLRLMSQSLCKSHLMDLMPTLHF